MQVQAVEVGTSRQGETYQEIGMLNNVAVKKTSLSRSFLVSNLYGLW
jgi:hypothetical protein